MNKYTGFNPNYMTEGVSSNSKITNLLDTRAMYKEPQKALPTLVALTSDYAEDAKYAVGKPFKLDATFTYNLTTADLSNITWEITPNDALRLTLSTKPDSKTIRKHFVPLKEGAVTIKTSFTNAKKQISSKSITLQIGKAGIVYDSLQVTNIVSCLFTDPTTTELKVGEPKEIAIVFDRPVPESENISIMMSENLKATQAFKFSSDRKSGKISISAIDTGYAYFKVATTGSTYVGFNDIPIVENPDLLMLVGISAAQAAYEGEQITIDYTFNKALDSDTPEGLNIIISNMTVINEASRSHSGQKLSVVYNCVTPGTATITAQLNASTVKTLVRTDYTITEDAK